MVFPSVRSLLLLSLLFGSTTLVAQVRVELDGDTLPEGPSMEKELPSIKEADQEIQRLIEELWKRGYLEASIDSLHKKDSLITYFIHIGEPYQWVELRKGNVPLVFLEEAGVIPQSFEEERVDPVDLSRIFDRILTYSENHGYPFASVGLDSIEMKEEGISASIMLDKGDLTRIDSFVVHGSKDVHRPYLYRYLNVHPGMIYMEDKVKRIDQRIESISFLSSKKPSEVLFTKEEVQIHLYLEKKKASRFNGVVGLQQDEETGKVQFTGDVTLALKNALNRGELIEFDWNRMRVGTQDLEIHYDHPFLFRTPFGTDLRFKLYKKDSTFTEMVRQIALKYVFQGEDHFRVQYRNKTWNLLQAGKGIRQRDDIPLGDVSINYYGVGFHKEQLDNRFNPTQGYSLDIEGSVGQKTFKDDLEEIPELSDTARKIVSYEGMGEVKTFFPMFRRTTLMVGVEGGWVFSPFILQNELYRLGGYGSLRGMDKEVIFASGYSIGTVEFRYLLERKSNLHAFFDMAYHEDRSGSTLRSDTPFGFGVGTQFETKAGIFSIDYAIGKRFDNPIRIRNGRVHFGFASLF